MSDKQILSRPHCDIAIAQIADENTVDLTRLSAATQRQAAEFSDKRRQQYLTGRALLASLLYQQQKIELLPEISLSNNGRPSFCDRQLPDFNISHSGDTIMVALSQHCQIGLDLEVKRPRKRLLEVAQYSFSPQEISWLNQLPDTQQEDGFWQLWTLRESVLKLAGKGIWQMKELAIHPLQQRLESSFTTNLLSWSATQEPLFWALSADADVTIQLYQANPSLTSLEPIQLPPFIVFSQH